MHRLLSVEQCGWKFVTSYFLQVEVGDESVGCQVPDKCCRAGDAVRKVEG